VRLTWSLVQPEGDSTPTGPAGLGHTRSGQTGDRLVVLHPELPLVLTGGEWGGALGAIRGADPPAWPDLLTVARQAVPAGVWPLGPARAAGRTRVQVVHARAAEMISGSRWTAEPDPRWESPVRQAVTELRLEQLGRRRTGDLQPVEHWPVSAVARIPTAQGWVWLKAVPPLFDREPGVLEVLGQRAPGRVPRLLAVARDEHGARFLMQHAGVVPDEVDDRQRPALARLLARVLAELQVSTVDLLPRLAAAGAADRSPAALAVELDGMLVDGVELGRLDPVELSELRRRLPELTENLFALADGPLPQVLIHGDYHPWNVAGPAGTR
jgi:hypothetical protein